MAKRELINKKQLPLTLEVQLAFEPNRLAPIWLQAAYEWVVPVFRATSRPTTDPGPTTASSPAGNFSAGGVKDDPTFISSTLCSRFH